MAKKIFTWLFVAFLIFFVATNPTGAARVARAIGGWLVALAHAFATFVSSLT